MRLPTATPAARPLCALLAAVLAVGLAAGCRQVDLRVYEQIYAIENRYPTAAEAIRPRTLVESIADGRETWSVADAAALTMLARTHSDRFVRAIALRTLVRIERAADEARGGEYLLRARALHDLPPPSIVQLQPRPVAPVVALYPTIEFERARLVRLVRDWRAEAEPWLPAPVTAPSPATHGPLHPAISARTPRDLWLEWMNTPVRQTLEAALNDTDPLVRWDALEALRDLGDPRCLPVLLSKWAREHTRFARNEPEHVALIRAIASFNDTSAYESLLQALDDPNGDVKNAARTALIRMND